MKGTFALASLDISTGECEVGEVAVRTCRESSCGSPGEIIAADSVCAQEHLKRWIGIAGAAVTPVPSAYFDSLAASGAQGRARRASSAASAASRAELAAIGALLKYVELTQIGRKPRSGRRARRAPTVCLSSSTRRAARASSSCGRARAASRAACSPPSTAR